ncbi:nicastrin-like isoform X1 [Mytilus edulis]|uniref:nicastrin-like isoform X1 n=1 Tax=Mytilus edulis TaxID=6550 RepID=UPI0039EF1735
MEVGNVFIYITVILSAFTSLVHSLRISNKTYIEIQGKACFRRMNGTHQIGCSSETKGNVGILYHITGDNDTEWLLKKGPNKPYIVLLNSLQFKLDFVKKLKSSGKVNGIIVIHVLQNETLTPFPPEGFSPDSSCPNDRYGLYHEDKNYGNCQNVTWNPVGHGMMFEDFDKFPIFVVINQTEVDILIQDCYEKYNKPLPDGSVREYPLCAVQLKDTMSGAKDAKTCYRRTQVPTNLNPDTYCDPLGDHNVIATIKAVPNQEVYPNKSVIVAAARLDSFSMFENIYPSADNHVTGIVGLLAAAEALSKYKDDIINNNDTRDILFAFFQGEAFDYIGSSRTVYDMQRNVFPMVEETGKSTLHLVNFSHISHFVEVNQLGYRDDGKVWLHTDPLSQNNTQTSQEIDKMIQLIKNVANNMSLGIGENSKSQPLPPASVQRFLRKDKIPAVVFSDHQHSYTNKYYNSRFDIAKAIEANTNDSNIITEQAKNLTRISTMLARTLYTLSTRKDAPQDMTSSESIVNDLLFCYLISRQCEMFRRVLDDTDNKNLDESSLPYPFYVSVTSTNNQVTYLTKRLLSYFIGDRVNNTKANCKQSGNNKVNQYMWMQGEKNTTTDKRQGFCSRSTAVYTLAQSPLFDQDDYNWNIDEYSAWTESSWQTDSIQMRIFLVPSKHLEVALLCSGLALLLISLVAAYFINLKASILFSINSSQTT